MEISASITFNHDFKVEHGVSNSILQFVQQQDEAKKLEYNAGAFVLDSMDEFRVADDVYCKLVSKKYEASTNKIQSITFEIKSANRTMTQLRTWINEIHETYQKKLCESIGSRRFFFSPAMQSAKGGQNQQSQQTQMVFEMRQMNTNKSLETLSGEHVDVIRYRLALFNDNEWHKQRGINPSLGLLLYGDPGCGKSSLIKAIAKASNRHVFTVSLSKNATKEHISALFYNEKVCVTTTPGQVEFITIPLCERLYLFEDADCEGESVLMQRGEASEGKSGYGGVEYVMHRGEVVKVSDLGELVQQATAPRKENIDLSFILNLFDGVLESPGQMIILTTNFPHKLDKALIRPGRLGVTLNVKACSTKMVADMFSKFYLEDIPESLFQNIESGVLTPAHVFGIMSKNIGDHLAAIEECVAAIKECVSESKTASLL